MNYGRTLRSTFLQDSLVYAKKLVCVNPFLEESKRLSTTKSKMEEQLRRLKYVTNDVKTPLAVTRQTISGKTNKDGKISGSFSDDLAMALMINLWMCEGVIYRTLPNLPATLPWLR